MRPRKSITAPKPNSPEERFAAALEQRGSGAAADLARFTTRLDPDKISKIIRGERRLQAIEARDVARFLRIDHDYLLYGDLPPAPPGMEEGGGPLSGGLPEANAVLNEVKVPSRLDMELDVPVLGIAVGGEGADFRFNGETVDRIRRPVGLLHSRQAFAIIVHGESMVPAFAHGDPAYVNPARKPWPGDHVIVECHGEVDGTPGKCFLKKLVRQTPKAVVLEQYNPPKSDIAVPLEQVRNIWRIVPLRELLMV